MFSSASTLVLTITLSAAAGNPVTVSGPLIAAASAAPAMTLSDAPVQIELPAQDWSPSTARWMTDRHTTRPAALPALYASLGALHALDVYSTRRALRAGGTELNPVMRASSPNAGAMLAIKALSTAGSIYFTERAWKKNRKGAVILMAVINGVTAAVVANNLKNAR